MTTSEAELFENSLDEWEHPYDRWAQGSFHFFETLWETDEAFNTGTLWGEAKTVKRETEYDEGYALRILTFQVGDKFFQKHGHYNSWDSNDWDGKIYEVRPREVTVTVYEKV